MTLSEAKASVLYEAGREKRITLRNLIIVGVLVLIGIFLGVKYLLPILSQQVTNVPTYVKFILPLALLLTIGYPLVRVWKIFKRREQVEEAFSLIAQGEECRITSETDDYLTVIPFGKRSRINMDPISYLGVTIKNKNYLLPVHYRAGSAEIKRVLTGADDGAYKEVMYELYNKPQANSLFDKAAERSEVDKAPISLEPVSEFRSFAQKELAPTLASMEKARSTNQSMFKGQTIIAIAFVVVMMILVFTGVINFSSQTSVLYFIIGFAVFGFLYSFLSMQHAKKKLAGTEDYTQLKTKIFSRIVHYISPDFQYIEKILSDYCLEKGKDLVIENLKFDKKKANMVRGHFKIYNEMLSSLAYAKFSNIIESKCAKKRIFLKKVNPAWTSYIAKKKYCAIKKLNIHSGASYVIARRGQELKDKVK